MPQGCHFLPFAGGTLLSVGWGFEFLLIVMKCSLDHSSSSELFGLGFGRQDGGIAEAGSC